MLSPQELRKDDFTKTIRGYSAEEVDEHINYIIEKYSELYQANDELERKLRTALSEIDNFRQDEKAIKTALINAQKASAAMLSEASTKADSIIEDSKTECGRILSEFDRRIAEKRDELYKMERLVELFKKTLFEEYHKHIARLEQISLEEGSEFTNFDLPEDYFMRKVKGDVEQRASEMVSSGKYEIKLEEDSKPVPENGTASETPDASANREPEDDSAVPGSVELNAEDDDEQIFADNAPAPLHHVEKADGHAPMTAFSGSEDGAETGKAGAADSTDGTKTEIHDEDGEDDMVFSMGDERDEFSHFVGENIDRTDKSLKEDEKEDAKEAAKNAEESINGEPLPENEDDDDDIIIATRTPVGSEMTSVKDAIKALNFKLKNEKDNPESDAPKENEKSALDDENDEFIKLLKKVTVNTEAKRRSELDEVYSGGNAKKSGKDLSITEEFNAVYNNKQK